MSDYTLTRTQIVEGVWQGHLVSASGDNTHPALSVTHQGVPIDGVTVTDAEGDPGWVVRVPIPATAISDGVQTFVIVDDRTAEKLDSFALLAGDALAEDIRAEMELLRAELDMLKRAFRRHCLETMDT